MQFEFHEPPVNPAFVGRKKPLSRLSNLLGRTPSLVNIIGPLGIGKTALAREVIDRMARHNITCFWIRREDALLIDGLDKTLSKIPSGALRRIVVIDDPDDLITPMALSISCQRLFRSKKADAIIIASQQHYNFRGPSIFLEPLSRTEIEQAARLSLGTETPEATIKLLAEQSRGHPGTLAKLIENIGSLAPNVDGMFTQINGSLFHLSQVEESAIIQAVRPNIITFSGELVRQLKKHPAKLHDINSRQFEQLIAELFDNMGWEVEVTKAAKDGGRDILAHLNTGVHRFLCLIEAKKYREDRPVGIELVKQLYGTLCDEQASSAMLVTTSRFTAGAKKFENKHKYEMSLKDYTDVIGWLAAYKEKRSSENTGRDLPKQQAGSNCR